MTHKTITIFSFAMLLLAVISCTKEAGEGGSSSIRGRVYAKYYDNTFTILNGEGYAPDKYVYIIYGSGSNYNDRVLTSYDGSYEFRYLQKGHYKIYTYSKDSTMTNPAGKYPVIREIDITKNNSAYELPDITIFD